MDKEKRLPHPHFHHLIHTNSLQKNAPSAYQDGVPQKFHNVRSTGIFQVHYLVDLSSNVK
jgi:hypothetical protein